MESSNRYSGILKSLGPGLLWAGAAIGVSHLVQSTRAGASYGFALIGVVILANIVKYPFFEFGPRFAAATGESLLEGYKRLGKWAVWMYIFLTIAMMFTIQAAVTMVTAGIAAHLTGWELHPTTWSAVLLAVCCFILAYGRYALLDKVIKGVIILLTVSTVLAVILSANSPRVLSTGFAPPEVWTIATIPFLAALIGWMPSAFDIAVWNSIWTLERRKQTGYAPKLNEALFDFRLGYIGTVILAVCFLILGATVMYGSGEQFSNIGSIFARQLIEMYVSILGGWSYPIIILAAFTTMFSTTLTVLDGFPRSLGRAISNLFPIESEKDKERIYWSIVAVLMFGSIILMTSFRQSMTYLVDFATTVSFVSAPVLAILNYKVVTHSSMPPEAVPKAWLRTMSLVSLFILSGLSIAYVVWRFLLS